MVRENPNTSSSSSNLLPNADHNQDHDHDHGLEVAVEQGFEPIQNLYYREPEKAQAPPPDPHRGKIWGVDRRVFFITLVAAVAFVVAAAVAGGLGGGLSSRRKSASATATPTITATATATTTITTATAASSTNTSSTSTSASAASATPTSDCPSSNNTIYTSTKWLNQHVAASSPSNAGAAGGFQFRKSCGMVITDAIPLTVTNKLSSFNDCIDLCADYNFSHNSTGCDAVTFDVVGNCAIGAGGSTLQVSGSVDSALLQSTM